MNVLKEVLPILPFPKRNAITHPHNGQSFGVSVKKGREVAGRQMGSLPGVNRIGRFGCRCLVVGRESVAACHRIRSGSCLFHKEEAKILVAVCKSKRQQDQLASCAGSAGLWEWWYERGGAEASLRCCPFWPPPLDECPSASWGLWGSKGTHTNTRPQQTDWVVFQSKNSLLP